MEAQTIIEKAVMAGVSLSVTPEGLLDVEGPEEVLDALTPVLREHKAAIISGLKNGVRRVINLEKQQGLASAQPEICSDCSFLEELPITGIPVPGCLRQLSSGGEEWRRIPAGITVCARKRSWTPGNPFTCACGFTTGWRTAGVPVCPACAAPDNKVNYRQRMLAHADDLERVALVGDPDKRQTRLAVVDAIRSEFSSSQ